MGQNLRWDISRAIQPRTATGEASVVEFGHFTLSVGMGFANDNSTGGIKGDIGQLDEVNRVMDNIETVFHFAANTDDRYRSEQRTDLDLRTGTIGTYNVLESMRLHDASRIVFSSSSTVYGESSKNPTPRTTDR